jgi:ketosteroid isomerase-like protein
MSDQTDIEIARRNELEELRQLSDQWIKALVNADRAALDLLLADDFVFAYPMDGDSKAQIIEDVDSGDLRVEYIKRSHVDVNLFGPTAVVTALDDARWNYKGHLILGHYKIMLVFSRRNDLWQLVSVQACPLTPQKNPA